MQPAPVFLLGESNGQRSLAGYSPWGCKESDTPEATWHTQSLWDLSYPTRDRTHPFLHWKPRVLTTGPPGKSPIFFFFFCDHLSASDNPGTIPRVYVCRHISAMRWTVGLAFKGKVVIHSKTNFENKNVKKFFEFRWNTSNESLDWSYSVMFLNFNLSSVTENVI